MQPIDATTLDQISDRYFGWHDTHFSRAWEHPWVANQLDLHPGVYVLDAGAGRSPLPFFCAERGAIAYTVDNGSPEWEEAWGYFDYSKANPAISSFNTDLCSAPWAKDIQFDFIISVSVMEHLTAEERRKAWREFSRILKVKGRLVLTVDLQLDGFNLWNRCRGLQVESAAEHGTLASILRELRELGFILNTYELCPLVSDTVRVAGLDFTKAAQETANMSTSPLYIEQPVKIIHDRQRVLFGCVAESNPKYLSQAIRLLQSIRWFGGTLSYADVMLCVVDGIDSAYRDEFEQLGANVRVVPPFSHLHPPRISSSSLSNRR
jgi:SAM-dependent methyltransferase